MYPLMEYKHIFVLDPFDDNKESIKQAIIEEMTKLKREYQIIDLDNLAYIEDYVSKLSDCNNIMVHSVGNSALMSGYYQYNFDIDGTARSDAQMISQYRACASYPDVDTAIEAIVNEAVIVEQSKRPVELNLDELPDEYSAIKQSITDAFDHILNVLEFNDNCHDIFKRWYIDGKLYYFVVIDPKDPKKGIIDLKYVDPRKIRKVIEYVKENQNGVDVITGQRQYYLFNDQGLTNAQNGLKISTDSIINVRSGLIDANSGEVISYLFKAIKPTNQLKMMEDSLVIYRITRAPERRVFYVDVGNLPGQKAEQYVRNIMNRFRNKVVYDASTGEIKNNRQYLSALEDFWLPRREGGKATEIQTLPSGGNLAQVEDVEYFQRKLYQALGVPRQRLLADNLMSIGNNNEITREEVAFSKFIQRLRNRFNVLFKEALRIQLIATKTIRQSDWEIIRNNIFFEYQHDNYFEEIKRIELFNQRMTQLQTADGFKGVYFSKQYITKNVLDMNEEQWNEIKQQIKDEAIEEALANAELEKKTAEYQAQGSVGDSGQEDSGEDQDSDDGGYSDFVGGDEGEDNQDIEQSGDTTNTIDDTETPNPGEDDFERPAATGLTVAGGNQ